MNDTEDNGANYYRLFIHLDRFGKEAALAHQLELGLAGVQPLLTM